MDQDPDYSDISVTYRFAIIGGGLTATSLLCQLVDELQRRSNDGARIGSLLAVEIIEKHHEVGPGLPHNPVYVLPFHITNMCAKDMTVRISRPDDFQRWVSGNKDSLSHLFCRSEFDHYRLARGDAQCVHYPRELMGEYLKSQFDDAVARGKKLGISVKVRNQCEVVDLRARGSQLYLTAVEQRGTKKDIGPFHGALLATGHWSESRKRENYFSSPWPAEHLRTAIAPGAAVGVIGSSLSAIETALTLTADGRFHRLASGKLIYEKSDAPRSLTLFSRRGLVPHVRGRIGSRLNRYFTCTRLRDLIVDHQGQVTLKEIFDLLDRELSEAYGGVIDWQQVTAPGGAPEHLLRRSIDKALKGDGAEGELVWQTVLVQIFPLVRELYLALSENERQRFDREYNTLFFMHAATQPAINGEKLLALMEAGVVEVTRLGKDYRFVCNESSHQFEFHYKTPNGQRRCATFTYCVDARGQPRSIGTDSSKLTRNLIRRGLVQIDHGNGEQGISTAGGSIQIDPHTHRIVLPHSAEGKKSELDLFAVGAMTRDQIIDASMAHGLARSTETIARFLIQKLSDANQPD
ncbi:MAG: hypothetical protein HKP44_03375 [Desulfofustis sp.]|nr:hypothetical protein [Desulfofustis sp.]